MRRSSDSQKYLLLAKTKPRDLVTKMSGGPATYGRAKKEKEEEDKTHHRG